MFEIERGVPVPKRNQSRRESKYPCAEMEIGDSFFIPAGQVKAPAAYAVAVSANKRFPERKFVPRTVEGGMRIWRVE